MACFPRKTIALEAKDGRKVSLDLRHCDPAEAECFEEFWRSVASETTHTLQSLENPPELEKVRTAWELSLMHPRDLRINAFIGPRLVGQIGFHTHFPHPWTHHIASFGMMVTREFWGTGLARALLIEMEVHAKSVGVSKIEAAVRIENARGVEFYKRAGYRIEGTRTRAALINGRFQDEYYIAKDL